MKELDTVDLGAAIRRAFDDVAYPRDDSIPGDTSGAHLEARQVARYFRGRNWRNVDLPFLLNYDESADASACLSFMSPEAFRYYLPAFLLIALEHFDDAGLIASTTVSKLIPWADPDDRMMTDFVQQRLSGFTSAQREVIKAFLKHVHALHPDEISADDLGRALDHWK